MFRRSVENDGDRYDVPPSPYAPFSNTSYNSYGGLEQPEPGQILTSQSTLPLDMGRECELEWDLRVPTSAGVASGSWPGSSAQLDLRQPLATQERSDKDTYRERNLDRGADGSRRSRSRSHTRARSGDRYKDLGNASYIDGTQERDRDTRSDRRESDRGMARSPILNDGDDVYVALAEFSRYV